MINKQPAIFNIEQLEVGYSKIRVIHNTPSDIDIASRSVWVKAAGANQSTANRVDTAYISKDHLYVDTLTAGTSYDFSFSLVDAFVSTSSVLLNAQYTGVESVLSITEQNAVSMKTPCTITSVINVNNDQEQIGSPASTVQITFAGTAATSLVEASTDNFSTSEVIYTGAISDNIIAITLSANTYKFRVTSYFTFSDGVVDTGSTDTFSTAVSVSDNITDPAAATGLTASAVKILDNIASHNLKLDWSWSLGITSQKQNTLVQYIEYDGTSAVNWTNAVSEISLGTDHTFNSVPYRKHLKVKVQVQGWNNNPSTSLYADVFISEDTADSTKTGYILAVDGESLSANTKVYIDSKYIQGFDTSADKTFEFDAATGNVTIGKAGTYNGTSVAVPFQFDAVNSILNISGQVITDEIVAADFVMGWLGGSPPSFRTSNRNATTGYSGTTEGLWMGYTDASTFKFSMGDGTQYIKWNGSQLSISGSVTIGDPTGPTLGQQQKSVMYYKDGTTAPNTPTGGTFASPTPTNETGWTTSIPTLATGPDNAYLSQRTFTSDGAAPQDSSWTAPGLFTAGGARGAGNYSKTNASWTSDSNFTTANVNSALPDGVPVIGDIVILSNTDSATWNRTARYVGGTVSPSPLAAGGWERFTLVINGNALVTGTVVADNFEAISYAADNTTIESTVKLNKGNDLIFAAASVWNPDDGSDPTVKSLETIFQITKDGDGIIDGKAVSVRSIFPSSFSEQAVDYIQNAIGATVNSGGLKSYNGPSGTLTNNSIIQKNLNPLTHVNGNPTTISGEGLVSFSNDYSYSTPVAANITMTLNRRLSSQTQSQTVQIATTGSVAVTTSSVLQQGAQGEPSEWTHSYYWNETLTPTAEDLTSGDYVYDIRISCSNTSVIDSVGLTFSVEEQVITAGVDLSDYATEAEVDTKLLDYVLDTDSRLTNARTATLTGNLLTAVPTNALFTDTFRPISSLVSSTSSSVSASSLAVKTAYDKANAALPKTGGTMTGSIGLSQNPVGTTYGDGVSTVPTDMISQVVGSNDGWRLYGESPASNDVKVIFEVTDDLETGDTWVFRNKKTYSPYTATEPFKINGNGNITALGTVTATGGNSGNWNTAYGWGNHASAGYQQTVSVNAPSITSTTVVDETIEIVIGASTFSGVDHYEVWSDGATGSDYSLIARIAEEDIASSMSIIDTSFEIAGTIAYRVYAISNGTYSTAATDTQVFVMPTLDVINLSIIPDLNVYHIEYNIPDTRFIDHIEIYVDKHAVLGSLSRSNAVLSYSGNNKQHTYSISNLNLDNFHQFWVEIVST